MSKKLVVVGGTGKQGGAVLDALHSHALNGNIIIYAVHRKPVSATTLRNTYPSVTPILGDIDNSDAIFRTIGSSPDALYFMTPGGKNEVQQGKAILSAAVRAGTKHIVMSSIDRGTGGNVLSGVDIWDTKHEIEAFLRCQSGITYTIIRPVAFLENFVPGFEGRVFVSMWRDYLSDRKLALISTKDIGATAAKAMLAPEAYRNIEINLAGDNLTFEEASRIFAKETGGKKLPAADKFLTWVLVVLVKDLKQMVAFYKGKDSGAVVQPDLVNWEAYIRQSEYVKKR
ncbi:nucleoside-diphosphate-sugar epimerase family protein [Xylogone sp. PMI_703]|nr:nucleoside-diphosphate-sugar epimerase family protein [Xylogone sp. PMI_703]